VQGEIDSALGPNGSRDARVRVAVDAMGGDRGPEEVVLGALEAVCDGVTPILFGPRGLDTGGLELVEVSQTIHMDEKPAEAVRAKPDSSLVRACGAVEAGDADVVVSAGNTGAMLAAGLLTLRRLPGVQRPAIAVPLPAQDGPSVMLDCGANADARAEHLVQFAHMGSIFAEEILDLEQPSVRLLSIGEEPEKGNQLTLEAHRALAGDERLDFRGNVESRHLLETSGQVVVCDGFTGNVCLKAIEGTILTVLGSLREQLRASRRGLVAGLLMRPAARSLRARLDPDVYGGAYLLGLRRLAVIAHGNSSRAAVANAILLAGRGVQHRVVDRLAERFGERVVASAGPGRPPQK
jgi:glycerol-3-phosphate acyltransferase PlsX